MKVVESKTNLIFLSWEASAFCCLQHGAYRLFTFSMSWCSCKGGFCVPFLFLFPWFAFCRKCVNSKIIAQRLPSFDCELSSPYVETDTRIELQFESYFESFSSFGSWQQYDVFTTIRFKSWISLPFCCLVQISWNSDRTWFTCWSSSEIFSSDFLVWLFSSLNSAESIPFYR